MARHTPFEPLTIDFAALRTLRLVHSYRSFSRAAESLNTGQSSVSYVIERLRQVFGDPLFVRQGGQVVPTDRCNEIVATTSQMLDDFLYLSEPKAFDPSEATGVVVLSCNYFERAALVPGLMRRLRRKAPNLKLSILSSTVMGKEQLDRGESDLLIGPIKIEANGFYRRTLMRDSYVCVMDPANPLAQKPLTKEAYLAAPHVLVNYGGGWKSQYLVDLEEAGRRLNTVMEVPSPAALPILLEGTDLVSTVALNIAKSFGARVHYVPSPFPSSFEIDLTWTARTHKSPMFKWVRDEIAQVAAENP